MTAATQSNFGQNNRLNPRSAVVFIAQYDLNVSCEIEDSTVMVLMIFEQKVFQKKGH